jgi:hypothetical protein
MLSLSDLLLKYHVPGVRESEIRRICAQEASALTGYELSSKSIQYKNEKLTLSVPPVLKSALLLRREELLKRIQDRGVAIRTIQ